MTNKKALQKAGLQTPESETKYLRKNIYVRNYCSWNNSLRMAYGQVKRPDLWPKSAKCREFDQYLVDRAIWSAARPGWRIHNSSACCQDASRALPCATGPSWPPA